MSVGETRAEKLETSIADSGPNVIRSVLAVLAGIVTLTVLAFAIEAVTNPLLQSLFPQALPNELAINRNAPLKLFMLAYGTLCGVAGGYVTAWVARRAGVWHASIMGAIQVSLTALAMTDYMDTAPLWVWIAGMVLTVPAAWCGGNIRSARVKQRA